jgi:hypothetical protein
MPAWQALAVRVVMATPLKLLASIGSWVRSWEGLDLKLYPVGSCSAAAGLRWVCWLALGVPRPIADHM